MKDNAFFKPTPLYKEFMILDLIEKDSKITQREMASEAGMVASMVNGFLDDLEKRSLIKRTKHSTKNVEYFITKKGIDRKKVLNIMHLSSSLKIFNSAKENVIHFLDSVSEKGYKKILLYGAGEVAEILLQTIVYRKVSPIEILAIIDDDEYKHGNYLLDVIIIQPNNIINYDYDAILVSSYTHQKTIIGKLKALNYPIKNILYFFNE